MTRATMVLVAMATLGCTKTNPPSTNPTPTPRATAASGDTLLRVRRQGTQDVFIADSFSPKRGAEALKAFKPAMAPSDSGGECSLSRTSGSGATIVTASFPARMHASMSVNMVFDSAGHLVSYAETRGLSGPVATLGMTPKQRDSTLAAHLRATRSTNITLQWGVDRGVAMNRIPGEATDAVIGTVREVESLPQLGPVTARLERVRRLCGV